MRSRTGHAQQCNDPPRGMCDSKADYLAIFSIHKLVSRRLLRNKLPNSNSGWPHEPLFVCIKNSSPMAEALLKMSAKRGVEVCSAGIKPGKKVNKEAVKAMREVGYDVRGHKCRHISCFSRKLCSHNRAYFPPSASNSSCVPRSMIRLRSSTRIWSARTIVESRCAIIMDVRSNIRVSSASWMSRSVVVSMLAVASSRTRIGGYFNSARAIESRCFFAHTQLYSALPHHLSTPTA